MMSGVIVCLTGSHIGYQSSNAGFTRSQTNKVMITWAATSHAAKAEWLTMADEKTVSCSTQVMTIYEGWKQVLMLRSVEVVNWWSQDGNREFTTCEWNTLLSPAYFFHEVVNSGCTKVARVRKHEFTSCMERYSRDRELLINNSWSRVHKFCGTQHKWHSVWQADEHGKFCKAG